MVQFVYCDGVLKDSKCRNMALALNFYGLESQISPVLLKRFLPFKRHLMEVPKFFMPTVSHQKKVFGSMEWNFDEPNLSKCIFQRSSIQFSLNFVQNHSLKLQNFLYQGVLNSSSAKIFMVLFHHWNTDMPQNSKFAAVWKISLRESAYIFLKLVIFYWSIFCKTFSTEKIAVVLWRFFEATQKNWFKLLSKFQL